MIAIRKIFLSVLTMLVLKVAGQPVTNISLAGMWAFKIDSLKEGEASDWFSKPPSFFQQQIKLPEQWTMPALVIK